MTHNPLNGNKTNNRVEDDADEYYTLPVVGREEKELEQLAREKTGLDQNIDKTQYKKNIANDKDRFTRADLRAAAAANNTTHDDSYHVKFTDEMAKKEEKRQKKFMKNDTIQSMSKHRRGGAGGSTEGTRGKMANTGREEGAAVTGKRLDGALKTRVHVYSIPKYSYYVPAKERRAQELRMAASGLVDDGSVEKDDDDLFDDAEDNAMLQELLRVKGIKKSKQVLVPLLEEEIQHSEKPEVNSKDYEPLLVVDPTKQPPTNMGRLLEKERYQLPECPPYRIPLYDQACHKYVFSNLFSPGIEFMEFFYLCFNLVMVIVNLGMTIINVFFNDYDDSIMEWVKVTSIVVFSIEFAVVCIITLFLLITIAHAFIVNNVGTTLAIDVATLMNYASTFSMLRLIGFASPSYATREILPIFLNATQLTDYLLFLLYGAVWLCLCIIAFLALIMKVTQIDFAFTESITEWTFPQFVQLIGLLMNLARVDDSYLKETSVLLDAINRHYIKPGEPRGLGVQDDPCLYSKLLRCLHMPQYQYYEYFNVIFDFHMDWHLRSEIKEKELKKLDSLFERNHERYEKELVKIEEEWEKHKEEIRKNKSYEQPKLPLAQRMRKCFNYLAFIFQIDNVQLRRFLQMVQSPLPFYQVSRQSFMVSFVERDKTGMDIALWRSDPIAAETRAYANKNPDQFNISFMCEERRDIWDPKYYESVEAEDRGAIAETLKDVVKPKQH